MTIVVKIGSQSLLERSSAANPDSRLDQAFMTDLVHQIAQLKQQGHTIYLVSSGAVAAGRSIWKQHQQVGETAARQILAGLGQVELMQIYKQIAAAQKLHVVQLLLTKSDFISRSHYLNLERLLLNLQDFPELLPVINENDSISIDELMFTDNDQLAGVLSQQLGADLLLLLTEAPGIFDKDPHEAGGGAQLFPLLWAKHGSWPKLEGKSRNGRGGIGSKLETAQKMSRAGVLTNIASARQPQIILRVVAEICHLNSMLQSGLKQNSSPKIAGSPTKACDSLMEEILERWSQDWSAKPDLGTLVLPALLQWPSLANESSNQGKSSLRGVRKWLSTRNLAAGHARIIVNEGLAQKLCGGAQAISILPIGIVRFEGEFAKNDLIDIYSEKQEKLGIGLARYSHLQLSRTIAKKNQAIFIHYNYLHIEN